MAVFARFSLRIDVFFDHCVRCIHEPMVLLIVAVLVLEWVVCNDQAGQLVLAVDDIDSLVDSLAHPFVLSAQPSDVGLR